MKLFSADWILPVAGPPIENAAMLVDRDNRISFIGPRKQAPLHALQATDVQYESSVILPGLVNAHTHLEFSDLNGPLGHPGIEFTQWIAEVIKFRFGVQRVNKSTAIKMGIQQSLNYGVAAIGEIATTPLTPECYLDWDDPPALRVYFEQLGSDQTALPDKQIELDQFLSNDQLTIGISPHAPYSVGDELFDQLLSTANRHNAFVAMHVAETQAEREFVEHKTGPFLELLQRLNVWQPQAYRRYQSILDILRKLSTAHRALVVHGNYLTGQELDFIGSARHMSIAFCPRTHKYFGHSRYPLQELLDRGINVAVGTDSRASNPNLNLRQELTEIAQSFPDVSSAQIIAMGTIAGARALGWNNELGTLAVGKLARFCVVPNENPSSPYCWLKR